MNYKLISPTGTEILGTLEKVYGIGQIQNVMPRKAPGAADCAEVEPGFAFDWEGTTKIDWDTQSTERQCGERVFVDKHGNEFLARELRCVEFVDPAGKWKIQQETVNGWGDLKISNGDESETEHWSSPSGCHQDCPACIAETYIDDWYDSEAEAQKHLDEMREGIPDFGGRVVPASTEQEDDLYS